MWTENLLYAFSNTDGANPNGRLLEDSHGNLYGTKPIVQGSELLVKDAGGRVGSSARRGPHRSGSKARLHQTEATVAGRNFEATQGRGLKRLLRFVLSLDLPLKGRGNCFTVRMIQNVARQRPMVRKEREYW